MDQAIMPAGSLDEHPGAFDGALSLALTLATRLCHDLAGTAGALAAALDMAADGQEEDALPLAQDCARELTARLRLLRAAFSDGETSEALSEMAAGLPGADRLKVDLACTPGETDGLQKRLAANMLLLAAQALPRGGAIALSVQPDIMVLEIVGPRAAWPASLARCLANPAGLHETTAAPREVGVAIVCMLASAMGLRITVESETRLRLG